MVFEIPAKSSVEISIEFEKSILKWLEYPPDANKGFYVNSALITTLLPEKSNFTGITRMASTYAETFSQDFQSQVIVVQLYTESLLVNLPTPDFSMPYNVICLTCTVVALAFGPLHNITTKTLTLVETKDAPTGVLDKLKSFFKKSSGKKNTTEKNEESTNTEEDKMVECNLCKEKYSETHIEVHLVGVHGVAGPRLYQTLFVVIEKKVFLKICSNFHFGVRLNLQPTCLSDIYHRNSIFYYDRKKMTL